MWPLIDGWMDGWMGNGIETGSGRVLWYSSVPGLEDLIFTEPIVRHRLILLTPLSLSSLPSP